MSDTRTTTTEAPQWAIDAAAEIYDDEFFRSAGTVAKIQYNEQGKLAAIIAKHEPKDATIARLESENARFREALQHIRQLLKDGRITDAMLVCVTSGSNGPFIVEQH